MKKDIARKYFPALLGELILLMEEHRAGFKNDVLGEFHQRHFAKGSRKAQYFTPEPITTFMAQIVGLEYNTEEHLNVLDPACGSGKNVTISSKYFKSKTQLLWN